MMVKDRIGSINYIPYNDNKIRNVSLGKLIVNICHTLFTSV